MLQAAYHKDLIWVPLCLPFSYMTWMMKVVDDIKLIGRVGLTGRCWATKNGFDKFRSLGRKVANEVQ